MAGEPPLDRHGDPGRWRRRAVTVPSVLVASVAAFLATPLLLPALVVADLARARVQLPAARVWLVGLQYMVNEVVEVLSAPVIWLFGRPGDLLGRHTSQRMSSAVAMWSARTLARRAARLLGVVLEVEHGDAVTTPVDRRLIVVARHVSLLDAALPALVAAEAAPGGRGRSMRGVLMSELLADPGFDIVYQRMGAVFVDRDDASAARAAIRWMAETMPRGTMAVIFCEGRLFSPQRLRARMDRLGESDPPRAARLAPLEAVLPPKSAGFHELLAGAPDADVLFVDHSGLESVPSLKDLVRSAPMRHPVRVRLRFFERAEVPRGENSVADWLDDQYLEMDRWVSEPATSAAR